MAKADDASSTNDQVGLWGKWRALLDRERDQRLRLLETKEAGGKQHRVAVREWWGTVSEVLEGIKNVTDLKGLPQELIVKEGDQNSFFGVLAGLAAYLAVGQIPDLIEHARGEGRTAPGPREARDIRWAVTYFRAVQDGLVPGHKPVEVVRRLFELHNKQTVYAWCRKYDPLPREEWGDPSSLRSALQVAARRYRVANTRTWTASFGRKRRSSSPR